MNGRVGAGTVHGVFGRGEGVRGLTVAASTVRDTRDSVLRPASSAAAHGVFPSPESSTVSSGGEMPFQYSC